MKGKAGAPTGRRGGAEAARSGRGTTVLHARVIRRGAAEGEALVSRSPVGFFGNVDPDTGLVVERGHELEGECIAGRVLVFPTGKGSTVGSYTLYRLKRNGKAPAAIVCAESEPIVAVGAIIADIPMVDRVDISLIRTGDRVAVDGEEVGVRRPRGAAGAEAGPRPAT